MRKLLLFALAMPGVPVNQA